MARLRVKQLNVDADLNVNSNKITNLAAPTAASDAARKADVDAVAAGLAWKDSVRASTTAALPAVTYANGSSGVGATLTADANGALAAQDGVTLVANDRLLVKDQASGLQNGIYTVTQVGTGGTPFILTRVTDADEASELPSAAVFIQEGTTLADTGWVQTVDSVTVGTTALSFVQFTGAAQVTAGAGLTKTGNTLDVGAGDGISVAADSVAVSVSALAGTGLEDDGSNNLRIAAAAAGAGLTGGAGSALAVGAGDGITVNADDVQVNTTAIAGTGLENDGSNNLRIAAAAAGNGLTGGAGSALAVLANGDSVSVGGSGVKAGVWYHGNRNQASAAATGNATTGITLAATPAGDCQVDVVVNGAIYEPDFSAKTGNFYFSADGGTTVRARAALASGDTLYRGTGLGFDLDTSDKISVLYDAII